MARRRDASFAGRWVAGEFGDLFLLTDGVTPVFDWEAGEVHPDADTAAAAWERARVRTWQHEDRDEVWPPAGAVYDGIDSRTAKLGYSASRERLTAAVEADLADVETFREQRPDAAATIEPELGEYTHALELIAGMSARRQRFGKHGGSWFTITTRAGQRGKAA